MFIGYIYIYIHIYGHVVPSAVKSVTNSQPLPREGENLRGRGIPKNPHIKKISQLET